MNIRSFFFKKPKWDPSWGWDNQIYYLGSENRKFKEFFNWPCALYSNEEIIYKPEIAKLCAGSFTENLYFGSQSYDVFGKDNKGYMDQSVFVCNRDWELLSEFRPSEYITSKSSLFSRLKINSKMVIPFRDPALLPNGKISICTGGFRWGDLPGNICELTYKDSKFNISRETIIENDMRTFKEIERTTFWNEFMFFSVDGGSTNQNAGIQVAKLNKNGLYSYYGEVENTKGFYGPDVNKDLMMLFWYKGRFTINNPTKKNLFYSAGTWSFN